MQLAANFSVLTLPSIWAGSVNFDKLVIPQVIRLRPYIPGRPPEALRDNAGGDAAINLASNENCFGPSELAVSAAGKAMSTVHRYPENTGLQLREALSQQLRVDRDEIILGNGSNELLVLLAQIFLNPERSAIIAKHSFIVFRQACQLCGARIHETDTDADFGTDLQAILEYTDHRTQLIMLANPNNPTGTWFTHSQLEDFLRQLPSRVIVVLDEAYFEYTDAVDFPVALSLRRQFDNLVITRTFSKIYGLAGLRIGYAVANAKLIEILNRVRQPFNVNYIAQSAGLAAVSDHSHIASSRDHTVAARRQLAIDLANAGARVLPSQGNFLCFSAPQQLSSSPLYHQLLKRGIIVREVDKTYQLPNFLRVTIGTGTENDRFMSVLCELLETSAEASSS